MASSSQLSRVLRTVASGLPARQVQLAMRLRMLLNPQPVPWDEAAVALYHAERRGKGRLPYPNYLYGMLSAARTAVAVGSDSFSAIEFGVAGGNGLRALERHAKTIEAHFPLRVAVFGFDSGAGLLQASDPRDCAFALRSGEFAMDEQKLRARLSRAELVLGPVEQTVEPFMARVAAGEIPPIGFVSHDLDVFTGTLATLRALPTDPQCLLPRVPMYFDDLTGYPYSTEVAEWAAISTFNEGGNRKIGQIANLDQALGGTARFATWPRHFFLLHVFDHPRYNAPEVARYGRLELREAGSSSM